MCLFVFWQGDLGEDGPKGEPGEKVSQTMIEVFGTLICFGFQI